ncbi:hypothetical protein GCM10025864_07730 [Luteimicrobium album]|uniref:Uncharacterized protein n=1 Tax=Luteimicrobium album TaxID=1054550 RepID=A0ABQ6HZR5_9MICO|nr:hypothetical protein GCM10025864_07730 [Luteimicrobium album]
MALLVEREPVVDGAVEVYRELRDPQHRSGPDEVLGDRAVGAAHRDPARELELAVEPRVEKRPAVDLDAGLEPAVRARRRAGLELEPGESVWVPITVTGVVGVAPAGTVQAIAAPSRTTT